MAFIVSYKRIGPRIDTSLKIIKSRDVVAFKEAGEIVATANEQKEVIIKAAVAAFIREQQRGFKAGFEQAQQEQSMHMLDIVTRTVEYFGKIESKMVSLVIDSIKKMIGEMDQEEKIIKIVKNTLFDIRSRSEVNIRVNQNNSIILKGELENFKKNFPSIKNMEIIEDSSLSPDACVIETELGKVEASLSGQIEALRNAFERKFGIEQGKKYPNVN
ncbi:MAG: hypothetical protein RLZ92_1881 [Pseudomonadota bacterium]|jgi:type III secretion protein L